MFSTAAKNFALDAMNADRVRLHSGDPGASGTSNQIGSLMTAVFLGAASGVRRLDDDVEFSGLGASTAVTWFSIWDSASGPLFLASGRITEGAMEASPDGNYVLVHSTTRLRIDDPDE